MKESKNKEWMKKIKTYSYIKIPEDLLTNDNVIINSRNYRNQLKPLLEDPMILKDDKDNIRAVIYLITQLTNEHILNKDSKESYKLASDLNKALVEVRKLQIEKLSFKNILRNLSFIPSIAKLILKNGISYWLNRRPSSDIIGNIKSKRPDILKSFDEMKRTMIEQLNSSAMYGTMRIPICSLSILQIINNLTPEQIRQAPLTADASTQLNTVFKEVAAKNISFGKKELVVSSKKIEKNELRKAEDGVANEHELILNIVCLNQLIEHFKKIIDDDDDLFELAVSLLDNEGLVQNSPLKYIALWKALAEIKPSQQLPLCNAEELFNNMSKSGYINTTIAFKAEESLVCDEQDEENKKCTIS